MLIHCDNIEDAIYTCHNEWWHLNYDPRYDSEANEIKTVSPSQIVEYLKKNPTILGETRFGPDKINCEYSVCVIPNTVEYLSSIHLDTKSAIIHSEYPYRMRICRKTMTKSTIDNITKGSKKYGSLKILSEI